MPTYVSLLNWTDQGVKSFRQSVNGQQEFLVGGQHFSK
jgi:uncharacterized protein with GYD domain